VFVIVAILLRSVIAPIYVIGTVLLSDAFALGVSSLVFQDSDPAMPLFTFLFLVALGVDSRGLRPLTPRFAASNPQLRCWPGSARNAT
jgi:uncharacterized membrane protein YdfJ with MMPL/SSD domain